MKMHGHRIKIIACLCLACFLAGCGRRQGAADDIGSLGKPDTGDVNAAGQEESSEAKSGSGAFSGNALARELGITENKWQETLYIEANHINSIEIDADIVLPDTDHMCVLTLDADEMTGERKQALIESLAEAESISVYDEEQPPRWKADSMVKLYEDQLNKLQAMAEEEAGIASSVDEIKEKLRAARQTAGFAGDTVVSPEAYNEQAYWGLVDKTPWTFIFGDTSFCFETGDFKAFDTSGSGLTHFSLGEALDNTEESGETEVNFCAMSEQEAQNRAITFLEKLGYEGYSVSRIAPLQWMELTYGSIESWVDGWYVVLGRNVDGIVVESEQYLLPPVDTEGMAVQKCNMEQAIVWINSKGIMHCEMKNTLRVKNVDTQHTRMLDFENVRKLMQESLEQRAEEQGDFLQEDAAGGTVKLSEMRLMYLLLAGDSEYVMLPVWRLSSGADAWNVVQNYQFLNAIDGSEIDFVNEYYEFVSGEKYKEREGLE